MELYAAEPVSGYGHADDPITYSFEVPESVSATVKDNAVIGSATVYLDGYEIGTVDLVTHQEYISDFRTDLKATLELLAALILILAVLSFATMVMGRLAEPQPPPQDPQKIISLIQQKLPQKNAAAF